MQEQRFTRIGGDEVVAFHAADRIDQHGPRSGGQFGSFRADLLVRLGLVRVEVPPLRQRGGDVAQLAQHFATRLAEADGMPSRAFSDAALVLLSRYDWPGNVRELEDCIHRAVLLAQGPASNPQDLIRSDGTRLLDLELAEPGDLQIESLSAAPSRKSSAS
jgi:two-component system response regulator HydG